MRGLFVALAVLAVVHGQPAPVDLVIVGGTLVDGAGTRARRADVAIRDSRIVAVGRLGKPFFLSLIQRAFHAGRRDAGATSRYICCRQGQCGPSRCARRRSPIVRSDRCH